MNQMKERMEPGVSVKWYKTGPKVTKTKTPGGKPRVLNKSPLHTTQTGHPMMVSVFGQ